MKTCMWYKHFFIYLWQLQGVVDLDTSGNSGSPPEWWQFGLICSLSFLCIGKRLKELLDREGSKLKSQLVTLSMEANQPLKSSNALYGSPGVGLHGFWEALRVGNWCFIGRLWHCAVSETVRCQVPPGCICKLGTKRWRGQIPLPQAGF